MGRELYRDEYEGTLEQEKWERKKRDRDLFESEEKEREFLLNILQINLRNTNNYLEKLDSEDLYELAKRIRSHIPYYNNSKNRSIDADSILLSIILATPTIKDSDKKQLISFFESTQYGWHGKDYVNCNRCLHRSANNKCKHFYKTTDVRHAIDILRDLSRLFFEPDYGNLVLYIFCYCLAASFSSVFNREKFALPYSLQISCDKESVWYQLIHEIVDICNVNSGILEACNVDNFRYERCGYQTPTFYPTSSSSDDLEKITSGYNDTSVIIEGFENNTFYNSLIRHFVNSQHSTAPLAVHDRLNFFPIFLCDSIRSSFNGVVDVYLNDFDVKKSYLELMRKNKVLLASWALEMVTNYPKCFSSEDNPKDYDISSIISQISSYRKFNYSYMKQKNSNERCNAQFHV